ncbi:hypothetical protein DSOL_4486 [Desulfosporosinus metallidurans]|uniref:Uncharacterized protein n=1 Tax=Desulfosporosinus metallidurans TaxID=1888891 RepID=A0A1Q8QJJ5_9FIRM|nr:hypothetical protein DSOL_4486 [Desulfosporosinus metallidurans]
MLDLGFNETEIKKVLDFYKQTLDAHEGKLSELDKYQIMLQKHENSITDLQLKSATYEQRFTNLDSQVSDIKTTLVRMENSSLQSTNVLMNTLSRIAINTSSEKMKIEKEDSKSTHEIAKVKLNNNAKIILKALALVGSLIVAYFAGKGIMI